MPELNIQEEAKDAAIITKVIKWDLYTLIGCSSNYLIASIFLLIASELKFPLYASLFPLIIYEIGKILLCVKAIQREWRATRKDSIKDITECGLMVIYYVGIIVKVIFPIISSTFLIGPVALVIISRIIISKGLSEEFDGLYSIWRSSSRIFILLLTISITLKIDQHVEMSWGQTLWPYWLFFSFLSLMSLSSLIISFQGCCCHNFSEQNNFSMIVSMVWMSYSFIGITISTFSIVYVFVAYEDELKKTAEPLYIFIMYLLVLIIFTFLAFHRIVHFRLLITKPEEDLQEQPEIHSAQHLRREGESETNQGTTEQVRQTIPSFFMRISHTLFKPLSNKIKDKRQADSSINKDSSFYAFNCDKGNNSGTDLEGPVSAMMFQTEPSKQPRILMRVLSERDTGGCEAKEVPYQEEKCFICCEKKADGVLLPCSHGGLCFECARQLGHFNAVCHFCRKKFWQIVRVELNSNNKTDFLRVVEMASIFQYPQLPQRIQPH